MNVHVETSGDDVAVDLVADQGAIYPADLTAGAPRPATPRIKDLPEGEGPREKMDAMGAGALTDAELLALFFRTGGSGVNAVEMGRRLIAKYGSLNALSRCSVEEYQQEYGIGPVKAKELAALFEMGARVAREKVRNVPVDSPEAIYALVAPGLRAQRREILQVVLVNTRHGLIKIEDVSIGTINESLAHPREILRPAIAHSAYAMVLVHNHPSGDPNPSQADRKLTRRIAEAAEIVGIKVLDHLIIGQASDEHEAYFSFREMGLM
ncbi:MAG: DNA repair protein RadC [Verrucomicrobiales bacterium]|jgi:DNA repair protein RadC